MAQFELASEPPPENLSRDVDSAVKIDSIAPQQDDPDKYYISRSDREAVQRSFPDDLRDKRRESPQGARQAKAYG